MVCLEIMVETFRQLVLLVGCKAVCSGSISLLRFFSVLCVTGSFSGQGTYTVLITCYQSGEGSGK